MSAAKYLAANGAASGNIEKALYAYNNSKKYVRDVLAFANDYVQAGIVSADGSVWPSPEATIITSGFKIRWGRQHLKRGHCGAWRFDGNWDSRLYAGDRHL